MNNLLLVKVIPMEGTTEEIVPFILNENEYNPFTKEFKDFKLSGRVSSKGYIRVPSSLISDPINRKNFRYYVMWK